MHFIYCSRTRISWTVETIEIFSNKYIHLYIPNRHKFIKHKNYLMLIFIRAYIHFSTLQKYETINEFYRAHSTFIGNAGYIYAKLSE